MKIGAYPFTFLSPIEPNELLEENGEEYCSFQVPDVSLAGTYALVSVDETVHYLGETESVGNLFNRGFGRPLDPDWEELDPEEYRRINRELTDVWKGDHSLTDRVNLYFYGTPGREKCFEVLKNQVAANWNQWE